MAQKIPLLTLSVLATAAILDGQAVSYAGGVTAAGAANLGFATSDAAIGDMVAVDTHGTGIAIAGAAVAVGAALEIDSAGKVITKTSGVTVARALQAATAAGQKIEVLIIQG